MATPIPTNLAAFQLDEIARITGGTVVRTGPSVVGVEIDSRRVHSQNLFVALRGERVDAHDLLAEVTSRGAAAVLIERDVAVPPGPGVVRVQRGDCRSSTAATLSPASAVTGAPST